VRRGPFHDLPPEVAILSAVAFTVALGFGLVAPAIPAFAREFGVSVAAAASVISVFALMRVVGAALTAGSATTVSLATAIPTTVHSAITSLGITMVIEDEAAWLQRARSLSNGRIRLLGGSASTLAEALGGRPDIAIYAQPVTESGRVELLPFLHEQAVSITAHRFGTPNHLSDGLI